VRTHGSCRTVRIPGTQPTSLTSSLVARRHGSRPRAQVSCVGDHLSIGYDSYGSHPLANFNSTLYHLRISADPESRSDARRDLACRVRALRLERFLTQDELSELSGVGRATIARIERGKTVPQARIVRALARALGVEPIELVREPQRLWGHVSLHWPRSCSRDWAVMTCRYQVISATCAGSRAATTPGLAIRSTPIPPPRAPGWRAAAAALRWPLPRTLHTVF
jgi:DNA-binding XRE family transcriptional regulator